MAVTAVTLVKVSTDSTAFLRKYRAIYHVTTDAATVNLRSIVDASGVPRYGASYGAEDLISVVSNKSAREINGTRTKFEVTVTYEPYDRSGHNSSAEEFDNPLDAPSEYTWDFASSRQVVTHDKRLKDGGGKFLPVVNTAGDQFIPGLETEVYDLKLTVVQNLEEYSPNTAWKTINRINSDAFHVAGLSVPVRTALMTERSATSEVFVEEEADARVEYWQVKTVLVFRRPDLDPIDWIDLAGVAIPAGENSWIPKILNAGFEQLLTGGLVKGKCHDSNGVVSTVPQLLNAAGTQVPDASQAIYIGVNMYAVANFGNLSL